MVQGNKRQMINKQEAQMTNEQIKLLRLAIQREIEVASIDGMEHGAWGWAEKQADEMWKEFQESFKSVEINGIRNEI